MKWLAEIHNTLKSGKASKPGIRSFKSKAQSFFFSAVNNPKFDTTEWSV